MDGFSIFKLNENGKIVYHVADKVRKLISLSNTTVFTCAIVELVNIALFCRWLWLLTTINQLTIFKWSSVLLLYGLTIFMLHWTAIKSAEATNDSFLVKIFTYTNFKYKRSKITNSNEIKTIKFHWNRKTNSMYHNTIKMLRKTQITMKLVLSIDICWICKTYS